MASKCHRESKYKLIIKKVYHIKIDVLKRCIKNFNVKNFIRSKNEKK